MYVNNNEFDDQNENKVGIEFESALLSQTKSKSVFWYWDRYEKFKLKLIGKPNN